MFPTEFNDFMTAQPMRQEYGMTSGSPHNFRPFSTMCALIVVLPVFAMLPTASAHGQVSPDEHAQHHPAQGQNNGDAASGMMNGDMMGGMDGMMERMGAPQPKELYPKLMDLPDLPMEERARIQQEAHQRMIEGTQLLSDGLDQLAAAADTDDFQTMEFATARMREGLAQFESGLAAHRAIAEGKAPRNVALQWFKREMNLLPAAEADTGFRLFGMTAFHTTVMGVLIAFAATMIWMYFFKMRRATDLMKQLAAAAPPGTADSNFTVTQVMAVGSTPATAPPETSATPSGFDDDCCKESSSACDNHEPTERPDISTGLLRIAKRTLCRLRVAKIFRETVDVKTFRFVACHGGALPFSYLPGQFLTLTLPVSAKPIRRSYTISSSPTQGYYCEISVKREDHGVGSRYLHDELKEGDTLEVQAPSGKFTFTGTEAESIVLISGGVGITPMMSITRALTDMAWPGDIYFIVACRDAEHFVFETELMRLRESNSNLHVSVAMSQLQQSAHGYHAGRLTKERLADWVPDISSQWFHLCGPPPMMEAVKKMLAELGVRSDKVHTENFGSKEKPHAKAAERTLGVAESTEAMSASAATATVSFAMAGKSTVLLPEETVLEAAEREHVDIDYSCRVGMCGVCKVKLLSGMVSMEVEDGLEPEDKAAGMILACQAKATEDITVEA